MLTHMSSLTVIAEQLAHFVPAKSEQRYAARRSAVTIVLHEVQGQVRILMIERAKSEKDPWSGHMAFPGGRMDDTDDHSFAAAIRECEEEVGLDIHNHGHYLGRLSDLETHIRAGRDAMIVTPYVFALDEIPALQPNYEVADILWVPLEFLQDQHNRKTMQWSFDGHELDLPCYDFQERRIWGLSLGMLDEMMGILGAA